MKNVKRHFVKAMLVLAVAALLVPAAGCDYCTVGIAGCLDRNFDCYGGGEYQSYEYQRRQSLGGGGFSGPIDVDIDIKPGDINLGNIDVGGK